MLVLVLMLTGLVWSNLVWSGLCVDKAEQLTLQLTCAICRLLPMNSRL